MRVTGAKTMASVREPVRIVTAHRQREGAGFIVRRPFPTQGLDLVDPFLLLDEMGPVDYAPGEAVGAPDHPHRGFETITYMLEGEFEHEDSAGHKGVLRSGDVQWMTAGRASCTPRCPRTKSATRAGACTASRSG
jgi:redox-sensitive bicupin YhaK (pirin superfamily)